jgi:hypothetical protein
VIIIEKGKQGLAGMAKFCKNCGTQLEYGSRFCSGCGSAVEVEQVIDQQYVPPVQEQPYAMPPQPYEQPYAPPPYIPPEAYAPQQQYAPQSGQSVAPQQYPAPKKGLTKQQLMIIIIAAAAAVAAVLLIMNFTSVGDKGSDSNGIDIVEEDTDDAGNTDGNEPDETDEDVGTSTEGPIAGLLPANNPGGDDGSKNYPFGATSPDDFPVGSMSVNEVISSFGPPESVYAFYIEDSDMVMVMMGYSNVVVQFMPTEAVKFTYVDKSLGFDGTYEIDKKDWDLKMDISGVMISGPGIVLPFGLEVGKSTKQQVIDAYGIPPTYEWAGDEMSMMQFEYGPSDQNSVITYYFDINDELNFAMIMSFDW